MAKAKSPHTSSAAAVKRFELLTLGNELLLGLTPNGHLTFVGEQLARRGVELSCNVVISDCPQAIGTQFSQSWGRANVVITTGGLGPTVDDRTREAIAAVLGVNLVLDKKVEKTIAQRFAKLGRKMTPNNLKQAFRPVGAEPIPNRYGTAPGLWFEKSGKILIMLPGPPNELQPMWTEQVLPRLIKRKLVGASETYVQIRTAGVGESALENKLQPLIDAHPGLQVAYCAHQWAVDVRFTATAQVKLKEVRAIAEEASRLIGDDFVCFGEDTLGHVVSDLLRSEGKMLAIAESCTGGLLANCFTDLPGATQVFAGGVVCYGGDSKVQLLGFPECILRQHGSVSAECAIAMATAAAEKMSADFGLSVTGLAGPTGGTKDTPVGTIFIGLHAPDGIWCKRLSYPGTRLAVKARAVNAALDWLRRELLREQRLRLSSAKVARPKTAVAAK